MRIHCQTTRHKSAPMLMMILFLSLAIPVYAQGRVISIDPPKVSTSLDVANKKAVNVTDTIPSTTPTIYASGFSHNAFADDEVSVKWYFYKEKKLILIKKQTIDATGYEFIHASLKSKQGNFPLGQYAVVFQINMGEPIVTYFDVVAVKHSKNKYSKVWHYDTSQFGGWSEIKNKKVTITDLIIQQKSWNKKEQKLSLIVKANNHIYRDDYIFCSAKKSYYYCPIEDDGGYIKIDKDMNIELKVEFAKETAEGMVSELSVVQKQKDRWIPPVATKQKIQKDCSTFNKQSDKKMFFKVLKRYPELTIDDIKKHKPGRYYDAKYGVSIVAPQGWNSITDEGDAILYLIQGNNTETSKFMFKSLAKFWDDEQSKQPKKIIQKAARIIGEISVEEAIKDGDKTSPMGSLKLFTRGQLTIGHFVLNRIGSKARWESYTLIWEGTHLYILAVTSKENELLLGEFLSSLGMESFCSEMREKK